jgi:hypothetical protein
MGKSMTSAADWKKGSLPSNAVVQQPGTNHSFSVNRDQRGWRQQESEPGVFSIEHQLDYVVGSGSNGLTFLVRRGPYLFQAPLSFYSRTQTWDLSPGYEHVDLGFNRLVPGECINCHAGRTVPDKNIPGAYADPPFQELAVGCENCHGPGREHATANGRKNTIVNPAKLGRPLADNICLNCHQGGDARVTQPGKTMQDFRPGEWLFQTAVILKRPATPGTSRSDLLEHFSAMQASRCFRESNGKLSCLTCHDPHVQPAGEQVAAYYRPKCLSCHSNKSCQAPSTARVATMPPDDCIACHMPKRQVTRISHSELTNHYIPAREGETIAPATNESATDGLIVVNPPGEKTPKLQSSMLLRAYQQIMQKDKNYRSRYNALLGELAKTDPQDNFVQGALGDQALNENRPEDAIAHLQRAVSENSPVIYLELGQALAQVGRIPEAEKALKKGIELYPYDAVTQKTLILQYINSQSYDEARQLMEQYVATFPEDSFMRSLLLRVSK